MPESDVAADFRALLVAESQLEYGVEDLPALRKEMEAAAESLEFEKAALLRDRILILEGGSPTPSTTGAKKAPRRSKGIKKR
jgi:excinuclease UvrABC helicase subunit UvrB